MATSSAHKKIALTALSEIFVFCYHKSNLFNLAWEHGTAGVYLQQLNNIFMTDFNWLPGFSPLFLVLGEKSECKMTQIEKRLGSLLFYFLYCKPSAYRDSVIEFSMDAIHQGFCTFSESAHYSMKGCEWRSFTSCV